MKESFDAINPIEEEHGPESDKSAPVRPGMIKQLLRRLAFGSALMSAPLATAKDSDAQKGTGEQKENTTQVEKVDETKEWIKKIADESITVGKPMLKARDGSEAKGIYKNGVHVGDVFSRSRQTFDEDYFLEQVDALLDQQNVTHKEIAHEELVIGPDVIKKMDELGIHHKEIVNSKGAKQLIVTLNKDSGNVDDLLRFEIDMEDDGNPKTYARLSVRDGVVVLSGRQDDVLYDMSFMKDENGVWKAQEKPLGSKPIPSVQSK